MSPCTVIPAAPHRCFLAVYSDYSCECVTLLWEDAGPANAGLLGSAAPPAGTAGGPGTSRKGFTHLWLPLSCVLGQHVRDHWKSSRLFGEVSADVLGSFLAPRG